MYSLISGRKNLLKLYSLDNGNIEWLVQKDVKQYKLRDCQVVDGRLFIINIIDKEENNKLIEKEYSVDWECLRSSEFYKNLSNEILIP